ncbi:MAG: thioredoxin-dependent thiol peroxidase [Phycisphaeraceae bacterium]
MGTSRASRPVDPGDPAPDFTLSDQFGRTHRLADHRGRWVVLYFYPKDDTPGCTREACAFRDARDDLVRRGVVVLGVSPDDEASHARFADKYELDFPLLADTSVSVCQRYGVWQERSLYGRTFMGVARTTYLVDPVGEVAHRWDKVKVDEHAAEIVAKVDALT